jgi:hypothetical protein
MFEGVLLPLGAPPAAPCIRQTYETPDGWRSALLAAPLRFRRASGREVHGQFALHGIDPRFASVEAVEVAAIGRK